MGASPLVRLASHSVFGFVWHASNMEQVIYGLEAEEKRERSPLLEQDQNMHTFMFPLANGHAEGQREK